MDAKQIKYIVYLYTQHFYGIKIAERGILLKPEYLFIINPVAGKADRSADLAAQINAAAKKLAITPTILRTEYAGHAKEITAQYCKKEIPVHIYACGGDGTLNEVVQAAAGHPLVAVGNVPCGSGNDYVRNFGGAEAFMDMEAQLQARPVQFDLMDTTYGYGIDICAAGMDAQVAYGIPKFRRLPGCGGSMAYKLSMVQTFFSRFGHELRITLDGRAQTGLYMMMAICNGGWYGGGYLAAPYARMDDGLLNIVLVKPVPRMKILDFLTKYKVGAHLNPDGTVAEWFKPYMQVFTAKSVKVEVLDGRPLVMTVDGECAPRLAMEVAVAPLQLTALLPPQVLARTPNVG